MTSSLARFSSVLRARVFGGEPTQVVLPLATVLEEELAAIESRPVQQSATHDDAYARDFTRDDIADLVGLARALVESSARNPLRDIGTLMLRGDDAQPSLGDRLRALVARAAKPPGVDDVALREALAARFTEMLTLDLEHAKGFESFVRAIHDADDGTFAARPLRERNRILLETAFAPFLDTTNERRMASVVERQHAARLSALCLSGGGIRSASFAMGVVQGLANHQVLRRFNYLSTVSGGGYTGSWLSAWMARDGAERVHEQLESAKEPRAEPEPAALRHIRQFSYYLTPKLGFFSADTWTLIATITRNILLIWLVTLPVMAALLMLPRVFVSLPMTGLARWIRFDIDPGDAILWFGGIGTVLAIVGISFVQRNLYTYSGRADRRTDAKSPVTVSEFMGWCLGPLVLSMVLLAQAWEMLWSMIRLDDAAQLTLQLGRQLSRHDWANTVINQQFDPLQAKGIAITLGIAFWTTVYATAWLFSARRGDRRIGERAQSFVLSVACGIVTGALGAFASSTLFGLTEWKHPAEFYATFAVPMSLLGMLVSVHLMVGVASRTMTDAEREANSRFSAWLLIAAIGWVAIVGVAVYGPYLLVKATLGLKHLVVAAGVSGVLGAGAAASSRSSHKAGASSDGFVAKARDAVIALATPLFAVVVVILVSMLDRAALDGICNVKGSWCPELTFGSGSAAYQAGVANLNGVALPSLPGSRYVAPLVVLGAAAVLALIGFVFGSLIDTNRFSLHAMYRERLVRTFLGASRPPGERQANPFTGFDERDDMPIGELWPPPPHVRKGTPEAGELRPPLHVVNVTLNTVDDTDLATQNRKATSFTMTSLHSGASGVGYRRTCTIDDGRERLFGGRDGVSLGTAMAISGAAASPNSGYHSSPAVTFLMTLFNARLGWWLGNPGPAGRKTFDSDEPKLAIRPIVDEMFGRTTDHSPYVYLSDGGHFENLGLYEMVRRRCRFIVVSDAGCDPTCCYDDLGGAIRKIRVDFGIPIDFDSGIPIYSRNDTNKTDGRYWAVGRVRYSAADGGPPDRDGYIIYIKPAFYGREPYDVYNYANSTPDFPHESTANQFFGEDQFESYRALGLFAVRQMMESDDKATRAVFNEWTRQPINPPTLTPGMPATAVRT